MTEEADELLEDAPDAAKKLEAPQPMRVQLNFTAATEYDDANDVMAVYDAVVEEAQRRGLFFEHGHAEIVERGDLEVNPDLVAALEQRPFNQGTRLDQ